MPLKDGDIEVTNVTTGVMPGQAGLNARTMVVEFRVRGKGPYTRVMPMESYNAEEMNEKIRDFARQVIGTMELT